MRRAEETLAALEHVVVVLVPAEAGSATERLADPRLVLDRRGRGLERATHECGARLVGPTNALSFSSFIGSPSVDCPRDGERRPLARSCRDLGAGLQAPRRRLCTSCTDAPDAIPSSSRKRRR